jgi:hypothetical protein
MKNYAARIEHKRAGFITAGWIKKTNEMKPARVNMESRFNANYVVNLSGVVCVDPESI